MIPRRIENAGSFDLEALDRLRNGANFALSYPLFICKYSLKTDGSFSTPFLYCLQRDTGAENRPGFLTEPFTGSYGGGLGRRPGEREAEMETDCDRR